MDLNALSMIVWFFSAFFFMINTLVFARGKRVIKQSNVIVEFINLMILFYVAQLISKDNVYLNVLILGIIFLIMANMISGFFQGNYKVFTENKELFLKIVDSAIASVMSIRAVKQEKKNKTIFSLEEINKKIEVIEVETISEKKTYRIYFKRWINFDMKRQVLTQINEELENYDDYPVDKQMIALKITGSILLMVISLCFSSYLVMEKDTIHFTEESIPHEIIFLDNNVRYSDEDTIYNIHERLENTYNHKFKGVTYEEAIQKTQYSISYGVNGKIIYVGDEKVYIYVPDSEIKDKSPLHWVFWKVHKIFDKSEGTYYIGFRGEALYQIIHDIVEE